MEETKKKRLTSWAVLIIAMVFTTMGVLGFAMSRGILGELNDEAAAQVMQDPNMGIIATVILLLEMLSVAAIPLYAMLLVGSFGEGERVGKNLFGLLLLAVLSEIPFNLAMTGKIFNPVQQNPVFALLLCEAILWVYNRYSEKGVVPIIMWILATVAGAAACFFLRLEHGLPLLLCTCLYWNFRNRPDSRTMVTVIGSVLCILLNPVYFTAPLAVIVAHFYGGEHSDKKYLPIYVAYPIMMLICWGISFLF